jgi:hypothetical protein
VIISHSEDVFIKQVTADAGNELQQKSTLSDVG